MTTSSTTTPHVDAAAYDASNYRKHTSGNPAQRFLISRFHRQIADRIAAMAPTAFSTRAAARGSSPRCCGSGCRGWR